MRVLVFAACAAVLQVATAREWHVGAFPQTALADTEVTTNLAVSLDSGNIRNFHFVLDFGATSSNNVQAAFGCDANGDGVLSAEETGLVVGWDCGRWFVTEPERTAFRSAEAVTASAAKVLSWDLRIRNRRPYRLTLTENGIALLPDCSHAPDEWLFDRTWNLVRLTARGVDDPSAAFRAETFEQGSLFILR